MQLLTIFSAILFASASASRCVSDQNGYTSLKLAVKDNHVVFEQKGDNIVFKEHEGWLFDQTVSKHLASKEWEHHYGDFIVVPSEHGKIKFELNKGSHELTVKGSKFYKCSFEKKKILVLSSQSKYGKDCVETKLYYVNC